MAVTLVGTGWQRFLARLQANLVGAREMARSRWLIGSSLPYASHWIEDGWRDDPRYGRVQIQYRQPPDARFMAQAAARFGTTVRARRPGAAVVGGVFSGTTMQVWANSIAQDMKDILNATVYSAPVPVRNGRARWQRTHALYNSIRAYRA
jgi:hypothetical protein